MRHEVVPFTWGAAPPTETCPAAASDSNVLDVQRFRDKCIQVLGVYTGSCDIYGSLDGNTFGIIATVTDNVPKVLSGFSVKYLKAKFSALTVGGGTVKVQFGGFDSRSDGGG